MNNKLMRVREREKRRDRETEIGRKRCRKKLLENLTIHSLIFMKFFFFCKTNIISKLMRIKKVKGHQFYNLNIFMVRIKIIIIAE